MSRVPAAFNGIVCVHGNNVTSTGLSSSSRNVNRPCACVQVRLFLADGSPAPSQPVAGQEFMMLSRGDVVEVVLQNLAANANGAHFSVLASRDDTWACTD